MDHRRKDNSDVDIQVCSTTSYTGLAPSLSQGETEKEAYENLYPYVTEAVSSGRG